MKKRIRNGQYEFPAPEWGKVSKAGMCQHIPPPSPKYTNPENKWLKAIIVELKT